MMHILRIIPSMDPATGGPCQGIRNSIPELEKLDIYNEVVSLDDPSASFIGTDFFPLHALGPAKGPWRYSPKLVPWLETNIERFDTVIVHGLWLYHGYAVSNIFKRFKNAKDGGMKRRSKIPRLFIMPHGMLDPYFQHASDRKLKALRNWFYWKLTERKTINDADGILFTCQSELQLARKSFKPYLPKREINIGYGITKPPIFTPVMRSAFLEKCPQLHGHSYILFLSRIHSKKGVDLLIRAYKSFVENFLSSFTEKKLLFPRLVIAGPGIDTTYGRRIVESTLACPLLGRHVYFPGMLTGNAKWGAFYGCEAFILPSHQENFGIAVAEALACGKPVLISDQVNIWREIDNAKAGRVANDTLNGISELLEYWNDLSIEEKQMMGKRAIYAFEKYFAAAPAAQNLLKAVSGMN